MIDPAITDTKIATQLDAIRDLVQRAAASEGGDRTRAGILNSIALMLRQPVQAAQLLVRREDDPLR